MTPEALEQCIQDAQREEDDAYTTDGTHTPYLLPVDVKGKFPIDSVRNFEMRTRVASIAYDELQTAERNSPLVYLYRHPTLLSLISEITSHNSGDDCNNNNNNTRRKLYLSEDPIGACSINVFRPNYYHSFHFDESEFSTTLMLQEADIGGKFQYTPPLRKSSNDLALSQVAAIIQSYHEDYSKDGNESNADFCNPKFAEQKKQSSYVAEEEKCPPLHTLDFRPGTLSIFSGSRSLHQVTQVKGSSSRLVAVFTYASQPGFRNSKEVQEMFWGRSSS